MNVTKKVVSVSSWGELLPGNCERDFGEKETDFINCVAWQNKAEFISKWFKRGDMIALTGRLAMRTYETV